MTRKISEALIDRLVCAKYLYIKGREELESNSNYASGIATLNFQDSAELTLIVIAEYLHVSLRGNEAFNHIIDLIDEKAEEKGIEKLTHRSNLIQLNKARVTFKHYAVRPEIEDVKKFSSQLAEFYPIALKKFMNLDYENLSLVNLVKHTRTKNWLKKAEEYIDKAKYPEASACSRIAFDIFRKYNPNRSLWDWELKRSIESDLDPREIKNGAIFLLAKKIDKRINKIKNHVDILFDGIDPASYKKLMIHTPEVDFNIINEVVRPDFDEDGNLNSWYLDQLPDFTPSLTNFCFRFTLDSILKLQEQNLPPEYERTPPHLEYHVTKEAAIYVSPSKKEAIKAVEEGDVLFSYELIQKKSTDELIAVYDENMIAYISKNSVELKETEKD